jgi:hypothetical protein
MHTDRGALFCATGSFCYLEAALISALSLRQHEPHLPITLFTDCPQWQEVDLRGTGISLRLVQPDLPEGAEAFSSRWLKTRLASLSPYRESLYVDADMLTMQPLGPLWQSLEQAPIGLVLDIRPLVSLCGHVDASEKSFTLEAIGGDAPQFNGGLILWRAGEPTATLFQHWHQEWRRFARQDQLALARAIASSGIQVAPLPASYNTSPRDARGQPVHLLHCWGNKVQRGMFRRFAAVHSPQAVAEAQSRLQSLDRSGLAPQGTTSATLP